MQILTVTPNPVIVSIYKHLFGQVIGSRGCNGCLEFDTANNVHIEKRECTNCHIEESLNEFNKHSGALSLRLVDTYKHYLNENDIFEPDEDYTVLRTLV